MTNISRRGLLGAIFATGIAPMIGTAGILMPVKKIIVPEPKQLVLGRGMTTPIVVFDESPFQPDFDAADFHRRYCEWRKREFINNQVLALKPGFCTPDVLKEIYAVA